MADDKFQVAIVGGGLCGLALANALTKRSIPYHVYEARSSFTEIGAGINIGPNTLRAFEAIDSSLGSAIYKMCSRNPSPKETVWMQLRYGADTSQHKDYEIITELMAPPTGNMAAHRNDLLQLLANNLPPDHASFNKKVIEVEQTDSNAVMRFADGTTETASIVIACDGIHSSIRKFMLGDNIASIPQSIADGAYRALIPAKDMQALLGEQNGLMSQVLIGPNGYIIMYSVAGGENMNVGFWIRTKDKWTQKDWVKPHQKEQMLKDFGGWGETAHKIMKLVPDPSFWATHCHAVQPESTFKGRVCLIGDAAHSMPPHQGAGSGQAMEDAYVLAEVLSELDVKNVTGSTARAVLQAFEEVRRPHSQKVLDASVEAMQWWSDFHVYDKKEEDVQDWLSAGQKRFDSIWKYDLVGEGKRARQIFRNNLAA